jgi:transcriptional regulator with XRE-family HTH domain
MAGKPKNIIDAHVGLRIRMARLATGMSQETLADGLRLTFQQVQKYEKGLNRVGAGRLTDIARILGVPVSYFFEDTGGDRPREPNDALGAITEALSTKEGIRVARALAQIMDPDLRRRIADLLEAIVERETRSAVA